jgi:sialate O-acetylesterase
MKSKILFLMVCCSTVLASQAAVKFPAIFSDRAVLAKRNGVPVFGTAAPGEKVTVKFNGQIKETAAGQDGKWLVKLDLANSPEGPFTLQINDKVINDVVVGEVFLGSGQSNMEYPLIRVMGYKEACKLPENRRIRHFKVRNAFAVEPRSDMGGQWVYANGRTLGSFSALGYFFAKKLHDTLNVPVGIVNSSWGGTRLESWMSKESLTVPSSIKMGEAKIAALESYPVRFKKFLDATAAWEKQYGREDIPVKLPDANAQWKPFSGNAVNGGGIWWIRNKFTISAADSARTIHIYFGRVYAPAKVFVDGKELFAADAAHAWKNNPFGKYIKSGTLAAGEHEVLVRYHISHDRMHLPQPFRFGSYNIDGKGWEI